MAIDNGTNTVGLVIVDHDLRDGISKVIYAETLVADKTAYSKYEGRLLLRGSLPARLEVIRDFMDDMLDEFDPDLVACESPFAHVHAHAYAALTASMTVIDEAVYNYRPALEFVSVSPGQAKRAVIKGKFKSEKEAIREAILKDKNITSDREVDLHSLDEHCIDAIAVARAVAIRQIRLVSLEEFINR